MAPTNTRGSYSCTRSTAAQILDALLLEPLHKGTATYVMVMSGTHKVLYARQNSLLTVCVQHLVQYLQIQVNGFML